MPVLPVSGYLGREHATSQADGWFALLPEAALSSPRTSAVSVSPALGSVAYCLRASRCFWISSIFMPVRPLPLNPVLQVIKPVFSYYICIRSVNMLVTSCFTAKSTSSPVVYLPKLIRTEHSASAWESPMASNTCDGASVPEVQAEPALKHTSSTYCHQCVRGNALDSDVGRTGKTRA